MNREAIKININDVKEEIIIPDSIWAAIFEKQMKLALKYSDIENMGDLLETTENNINTAKGQKWIKDFAWRVTEELAEAKEADILAIYHPDDREEYVKHFKEELADALHFLVELTIIAGYDYTIVPSINGQCLYDAKMWDVVYSLGLMCNCLKNKPWKQSQMLTDRVKFEKYLKDTWFNMWKLLYVCIGPDEEIYKFYFKKNKVNEFRQRSKY